MTDVQPGYVAAPRWLAAVQLRSSTPSMLVDGTRSKEFTSNSWLPKTVLSPRSRGAVGINLNMLIIKRGGDLTASGGFCWGGGGGHLYFCQNDQSFQNNCIISKSK